MIGKDGSLSITAPGQKVTWFQFLQASRFATSEKGGWNSKTHWVELGLDKLHPLLVKQWTRRSLKDNALPKPRNRDSKLVREDTSPRREAERSGKEALKLGIDELTENEINAVLHAKNQWPTDWGDFLSYEVPLADESCGQLKIDLIGKGKNLMTNDGFLSLVELKQAHSPKNSPLMALTEVICYAIQIGRCKKYLGKEIFNGSFKTIRLILAAPETYWACWDVKKQPNHFRKMNNIVESVNEILSPEFKFKLNLELVSLLCENDRIEVNPICFQ